MISPEKLDFNTRFSEILLLYIDPFLHYHSIRETGSGVEVRYEFAYLVPAQHAQHKACAHLVGVV